MRPYDERLDHLLARAARVFADKGYHPTTMRDLSAASGMSLAGMYYYVRGKEDLLALIQERCFAQVLEGARQAVATATDPEERLQAFIRHHVSFFADHMAEMKVLSHETPPRSVSAIKRRYVDLLESILKDAAPEHSMVDRSAATFILFGMMNWIFNWYDPAEENARHEIGQPRGSDYPGGAVPAVNPVQHAKQDVCGGTAIHHTVFGCGIFENGFEQIHVTPLDGTDAAWRSLMRQHLHLGHVVRKKRHVMPDERLQPLLRVGSGGDCLPGALQDLGEAALLDQREQVLLATDVVVHPGERHAAGGRQVAHRGGMIALVREDPGGAGKEVIESLVVRSHGFRTIVRIPKLSTASYSGKGLIFGHLPRPPSNRAHGATSGAHRDSP